MPGHRPVGRSRGEDDARIARLRADRRLTPTERLERGIALSRFAVELREAAARAKR